LTVSEAAHKLRAGKVTAAGYAEARDECRTRLDGLALRLRRAGRAQG
jgi:hypothetical protein